ncbi:MAG: hypothetical protein GY820_15855 [Gammaproteobacteria bacterium]|nr:hypothetical protein [Gammaproteobacteria bacterium]
MKDGHLNKCKLCTKKDVSGYRDKNIDKVRKYDRNRGNRQTPEYLKKWRKSNPLKYKAHTVVNNQTRAGNLISRPCEVCGSVLTVAHHDDYNYPLEIRWLCQAHHAQWHRDNGSGING